VEKKVMIPAKMVSARMRQIREASQRGKRNLFSSHVLTGENKTAIKPAKTRGMITARPTIMIWTIRVARNRNAAQRYRLLLVEILDITKKIIDAPKKVKRALCMHN
jgi:hypothetical protein